MDLVDEEDGLVLLEELVDHLLDPLLEVAAEFGAGEEGAHVEGVDRVVAQAGRHLAGHDALGEALGDGRLADAGVADVDGIVLEPAAEDLDGALDLGVAADHGLELALAGGLGEVRGEALEGAHAALSPGLALLGLVMAFLFLVILVLLVLEGIPLGAVAVRDDLEELEALDAGLAQVIGGIVALLVVEGHEDVGDLDLLLAGGLGLQHGALDDALESRGLHRLGVLDLGDLLLEVGLHAPSQLLHVGLAGLEYGTDLIEGEGRVEDMLRGEVLVVAELRLVIRGIENGLDFLADLHLRLLHCALQRKAVLPREQVHLIYFRHGNIVTVYPHSTFSPFMHIEHDARRLGERLMEDGHDDGHDEFHRREIIIEEEDNVLIGLFWFLIALGEYLALQLGVCRHNWFY